MQTAEVHEAEIQDADVVVVGNGMVGHHYVETLRGLSADTSIVVFGEENVGAYDRVHLSDVFAGTEPSALALTDAARYQALNVTAYFGDRIETIDRSAQTVTSAKGRTVRYNKLVLATGSYPFVPPIPGNEHPRCLVYRTLDDLERIREAAVGATRGVVVGGGLLGLECANALKNLGLQTHVVEFAPGLMGVQLDEQGSAVLKAQIEQLGVTVHTGTATEQIVTTEGGALTMQFAGGETLTTDLIVFSAGIRPSDQLGADCDLSMGERGGIVINSSCLTSDDNVYAIGECALYDGRIFGLVAPGYRMAEVAAAHVTGGDATFTGADMSTRLKLLGVEVGSIGDAHGREPGSQAFTFTDPIKKAYLRMNLNEDFSQVRGAVLVGDCSGYDTLLQYFLNGLAVPEDPTALLVQTSEGVALSASDLPDTATICSCHNVSKGAIVKSIDGGCLDLGAVKACTKASTGCGGCAALLKSTFESELTSRGVEVDRSICEHFAHTRQELFHICQIERIDNFADLLASHGQGRGCDICKPAAASIFASLFNEHVLAANHVGLQDTNDHMLANMQKNGTYSVVPRIPGGEITPDKLLAIGTVAKQYDLYTKITGGQRIDLFGAQMHELPLIWEALIDAGFETGHAYGKSLRTVKSCVGSTWCRYGVQDSVAMALYLENRYKGLRSPHKLKMAASGCTRECAEAQSKDVGVIATENGWNLFVGGNGGMRPRHADLFATDLDDETLIRYIDRFLMFYVRTADRWQRTSVWLDNLDGGLAYAQQVIIDDSLGICSELEEQMSHVVGTYQCEWKSALQDEEKLKRFRQFVNTDEPDPGVVFVRERDQRRPATVQELEKEAV